MAKSKQKLIITLGLPASGKTTWAKEQVEKGQGQVKRVSKDDLRDMIDSSKYSKVREKSIIHLQEVMVEHYLGEGKTVIVDNTNFGGKRKLELLAKIFEVDFEIKDFTDVPLEECLERNEQRGFKVPQRAIKDMYDKYVRKAPVYEDSSYIICDVDGTLAHMEGRSPYDGSKVYTDKVDLPVNTILKQFAQGNNYSIIIVTGRDRKYLSETMMWLDNNDIPYDCIYCRDKGDNRCDSIVKEEILYKIIERHGCKPLFVLDDRKRVVDMWRRNGVKCLQVEEGNF